MGDYPDYTSLMQILGVEVTIPIEIKAVTVAHINVDLVAQTVGNIAVAIAASAVTLNVAIASSAVTLNVDVKAQTLTDFKITVNAQNVGVYSQPEWAAKTGIDKNFSTVGVNLATGFAAYADYTVPAGKTLFLCGLSFYTYAYDAANRNNNQIGISRLYKSDLTVFYAYLGGNGGGACVYSKPIAIAAGVTLRFDVINYANHNCSVGATVWGFEI